MDMCESTSTALSDLVSRFLVLPKICYYDNSFNLAKSAILRNLWVNETCPIVSDASIILVANAKLFAMRIALRVLDFIPYHELDP